MSYYAGVETQDTNSKVKPRLLLAAGSLLGTLLVLLFLAIFFRDSATTENAPRASFNPALLAPLPSNNLTAKIPQGYRAVAIPVDPVSGVEGWVMPGVTVDVVWSTVKRGQQVAMTIVENARVLSADRSMVVQDPNSPNVQQPSHITLLARIEDAQKIQLAKSSPGTLSLSLRGDGDLKLVGSDTTSVDKLLETRNIDVNEGTVKVGGKEMVLINGQLVDRQAFVVQQKAAQQARLEREAKEADYARTELPKNDLNAHLPTVNLSRANHGG